LLQVQAKLSALRSALAQLVEANATAPESERLSEEELILDTELLKVACCCRCRRRRHCQPALPTAAITTPPPPEASPATHCSHWYEPAPPPPPPGQGEGAKPAPPPPPPPPLA
jgi:hypothetical protein